VSRITTNFGELTNLPEESHTKRGGELIKMVQY
jgi:hypothetical protein